MPDKTKKTAVSNCDDCMHYEYDEEYDCYSCIMDLDEDVVKVLEGDAAVRFLIEHSGLAPEEISVVCHALDEQAAKWRI